MLCVNAFCVLSMDICVETQYIASP